MADNDNKPQSPTFKPIMAGLAVGSGIFLLLRFLAKLDVDIALPIGTFFGVALALFLINRPKSS